MGSQENLNDYSFSGHWYQPNQALSQLGLQFSAPSTQYEEIENPVIRARSTSFIPSIVSSHIRYNLDDLPNPRPNLSVPSTAASSSIFQSVSAASAVHIPRPQDYTGTESIQAHHSHEQPMLPPSNPHIYGPSAQTLAPSDWGKQKDEIRRLWIDENKTLQEVMKTMAEKYQFKPTVEQYKKQFKKWNWSKYLPANDAFWMDSKAAKRKHEENKDTVFEYRGQTFTAESLQHRLQRKKTQSEETAGSTDAPTPRDIKYSTPRDDITSPLYVASSEKSSQQPRWTPGARSNLQHPHQLKLLWSGHTRPDLEAIYHEAQELERSADIDAAEIKFCEALSGFESLLSATHENTTAVAYDLSSFYAQNDRMKDADAVLDWMTEKHIERFGDTALQTVEHLLRILDLFCTWSRHEDATAFLCRIIDVMGGDNQNEELAPPVRIQTSGSTFSRPDSGRIGERQNQPQPSGAAMPTNDSSEPGVVDLQLGFANGYIKTNDKAAEPFLLNLIEKCESHPTQLASQILRCRSALLDLYHNDDEEKMNEAIGQSKEAFWKIFNSEQEKTQSILDAGVEVAKWHVRTGQYREADDMFVQIQSDAFDTFSTDRSGALVLFRRIGVFYQNEGRWDDAEPWFEQALVICYRVLGEASMCAKNLEAALENQHYKM